MDDLKGRIVKGYELLQLIGSGGFGAVYQAHQSIVEREVAIKVILPHHANDPHFIRNFEAEAHLIARLEHPFIVPLYDFWRDSDGAYLVMRYYQAGNLSQLIHQGGALDHETIARMLEQIASALDTAHSANVIHRDIKPANILLDAKGNAYLSDFGLAEDISTGEEAADLVGSPAYISPEIIQSGQPSAQSDLYSLGFVLYEMLTGQYAFSEITPDSSLISILDFHLNVHIPDVLELSDAINLVIQRATAKDPLDRYPDAMSMAKAFRQAISGESTDIEDTITVASEYIVNPYKGLRSFDEADEFTFFGRDKLVKRLLQRLDEDSADSNFIALVGPSGSGKSSVVHAGLVPAIRRGELANSDEWFILDMVPGTNPFSQLVATLRSIALDPLIGAERDLQRSPDALEKMLSTVLPAPDDRLLLVIDQFEELFTQTEDVAIRQQFLDVLYGALKSNHFYLVIMLRADFYDRPMTHEGFGELIQSRTQVVLPLTSVELNNVITKPAQYAGLKIETDLTAAIIADVQSEAVALPLLQYALTEVFDRRDESQLTLESYQQIGGIAGALAHRADEIYESLSAPLQDIARQIFLRFVTLGEGVEDTRRRARRSELLSVVRDNALLQAVLDAFGGARLLTFDNDEETREPTVEVAHEALIREWNRLRDWLDRSRDDIRRQRMLGATARQWSDAKRDKSYLLRGTQLLQVEEWRQYSSIELGELERDFVTASIAERERIEHIEAERQAQKEHLEKQSRDRLRLMLAVFGIAAVVAGLLSVFAFNQANVAREAQAQAEDSREEAVQSQQTADASRILSEQSAEEARSLALASSALREYSEGNDQLALRLALDAVAVDPALLPSPPDLAYTTLVEISHAPGVRFELPVVEFPIEHIVLSPDGQTVVFGGGRNARQYFGLAEPPGEGDNAQPRPGGAGNGQPPAGGAGNGQPPPPPSPNAQGIIEFPLHVWNLHNRNEVTQLPGHESFITDLIFTRQDDGTNILVSASDDGHVIVWNFDMQAILHEMHISAGFVVLSISDDGETLLVSVNGMDETPGTFTLIDMTSYEVIAEYAVRDDLALARMTPDARYIVALHTHGDLITLNARTGEEVMSTNIRSELRPSSIDLLIDPEGEIIAVNTGQDTIPLFNVQTGQSAGLVIPSSAGTHRATFNSDGSQLMAVSRDGVVTIRDIDGQFFVRDFTSVVSDPTGVIWDSNHDIAIVTTTEGSLRVYSIAGEPIDLIDTIGTQDTREALWISDTEVLLAYRRQNSRVVVLDLTTGEERLISAIQGTNYTLSLSPGRQYVIFAEGDYLRLFNLNTGEELDCTFCTNANPVPMDATFINSSPDRVAVANGGALSLWELETQSEIWLLPPMGAPIDLVVSSDDGRLLAVALENEDLFFIDVETGTVVGHYELEDPVVDLAISPDNALVAIASSGDDSNEMYIIERETGDEVIELKGHDAGINDVEFLLNGTQLVSASDDTTAILWDVTTGEIINRFDHDLLVFSVSVSPDESLILTTPEDNMAHVWSLNQLTLEEVIARANENRIVRDLTESECARYAISYDCEDIEDDDGDDAD